MRQIAEYMYFSQAVDLRRDSERMMRLPAGNGKLRRTVLMPEKRTARLAADFWSRVIKMPGLT
ncbi:MAG: hypothetical protein WC959_09825 [Kiritimatiellales bacterium]